MIESTSEAHNARVRSQIYGQVFVLPTIHLIIIDDRNQVPGLNLSWCSCIILVSYNELWWPNGHHSHLKLGSLEFDTQEGIDVGQCLSKSQPHCPKV